MGCRSVNVQADVSRSDMVTRVLKASPAPIPVGRFGKPEEVADVVIMLVKNGYITGQTINVNGGWYFS
jgi:3-oxoacyl-[acyl-carrier protein] reductase